MLSWQGHHQRLYRVGILLYSSEAQGFEFSTNPTQRDDIEYAIAQYVEGMNPQLYLLLSQGRTEYLLDHVNFEKICARHRKNWKG